VHIVEMPIKCPVAPLEFAFLADAHFRGRDLRDRVELVYTTLPGAFTKPIASARLGSMLSERKIALEPDFLVERVDGPAGAAAVVGVGLNVSAAPVGAASLFAAGFPDVYRDGVLAAVLEVFGARYDQWRDEAGDPQPWLVPAYRSLCHTLGREVRVNLPGQEPVVGQAVDVDVDGRLVVRTGSRDLTIGAGEVVHVRPSGENA